MDCRVKPGNDEGEAEFGMRRRSGRLDQRGYAARVIVDPALRDLEAVGLQAMRAVEINGPAARACDAAAIGVDAGLDLARGLRAQEYQFAHATLPKRGLTHSTGYGGHGELRPRAALGLPVDMWISRQNSLLSFLLKTPHPASSAASAYVDNLFTSL